ncbi:hypothetical protein [Marinicrinis lubricantis]|uniref:CNNM transmembrane domain-containing protein n=1 Tax=Marinicrinis lubricantis TaxID=2086470 RepID=A0ABW1IRP6_9BACL
MKFSLRNSMKWSVFIFFLTFILSCVFSVVSTALLEKVVWGIGMLIVFLLVLTGIIFDMAGLAAAAAKETPFHAMAAERMKGARQAIRIVRNADRFSNFCNDVIGDISGIISGAASAMVVLKIMTSMDAENTILHTTISVIFTGLVSALTVGGKALGKSFAIHYANEIIYWVGKLFYFLERRLGIKLLAGKKKTSNGKKGKQSASGSNQQS